jgi:hypothetical protein
LAPASVGSFGVEVSNAAASPVGGRTPSMGPPEASTAVAPSLPSAAVASGPADDETPPAPLLITGRYPPVPPPPSGPRWFWREPLPKQPEAALAIAARRKKPQGNR